MLKYLLKALLVYSANRLTERSTWQGAVAIATAAGVGVSPELATQIIAGGTAAAGLIHAVFPEQTSGS